MDWSLRRISSWFGEVLQNVLANAFTFTSKTPDASIRFGAIEQGGVPVCLVAKNGADLHGLCPGAAVRPFHWVHRDSDTDRSDRLPVGILTGSSEEGDLGNGDTSPGPTAVACKPFQFDELAAEVAQLGVYWLTINSGAGGCAERLRVPFRRGR
jgi:hypothetical protein